MKKNIVALFLIAVMAVSVFGAVDLVTSTEAQAATPTVTTLYAPAFAQAGQKISLTGAVTTSTGSPVRAGSVTLYRWYPGTGWVSIAKVSYLPAGGAFGVTVPGLGFGTYYFQARYSGFGTLLGSTSVTRSTTVKIATFLSIRASRSGTSDTVYGNLLMQGGVVLPYQLVYVYKFSAATGNRWVLFTRTATSAPNGAWRVTDQTPYTTNYYAQFPETSTYFGSRTSVTPGV